MLDDLFRLDGNPVFIGGGGQLPAMSPGDEIANVVFGDASWDALPKRRLRRVTFRDVAFPRSLTRLTFTDCTFEDCLFLGTQLAEVEFHGCRFVNCNFWKARFQQVYLDPGSIRLDRRFIVEAPNAGISVFQALLGNFAEERQDRFYMLADIRFRRWKRYQIASDVRRRRVGRFAGWWDWLTSVTYEVVAGFGYKPLRFFATTLLVFFALSVLNYGLIGDAVRIDGTQPIRTSFVDAVFYTFSILTVLGFSSIMPATDAAKILTVLEALAAIGWLGIFSSILVKRFLR